MIKIKTILLLSFFLTLSGHANILNVSLLSGTLVRNPNDKIVKSTVSLKIRRPNGTYGYCTGVILGHDLILTAGHCMKAENLSIEVRFGNGRGGFRDTRPALDYISTHSHKGYNYNSNLWENGRLKYDRQRFRTFKDEIEEREELVNIDLSASREEGLHDIAVIKVLNIPEGYNKVDFHEGDIVFNQELIAAGYGTNSRQRRRNDQYLRKAKLNVIGYFQNEGENLKAWQLYSPRGKNICYGDSGGPLFFETQAGTLELVGTNIKTWNYCANYSLSTNVHHMKSWIKEKAERLGSTSVIN